MRENTYCFDDVKVHSALQQCGGDTDRAVELLIERMGDAGEPSKAAIDAEETEALAGAPAQAVRSACALSSQHVQAVSNACALSSQHVGGPLLLDAPVANGDSAAARAQSPGANRVQIAAVPEQPPTEPQYAPADLANGCLESGSAEAPCTQKGRQAVDINAGSESASVDGASVSASPAGNHTASDAGADSEVVAQSKQPGTHASADPAAEDAQARPTSKHKRKPAASCAAPAPRRPANNKRCPCGSGRKYKQCCKLKDSAPGGRVTSSRAQLSRADLAARHLQTLDL